MEFSLAKNEKQVASWDYADIYGSVIPRKKGDCQLVVTDKRLISMQETSKVVSCKDVTLKDVSGIHISRKKVLPISLIILSIMFFMGIFINIINARGSIVATLLMAIIPSFIWGGLLYCFIRYEKKFYTKFQITILSTGSEKDFVGVVGSGGKGLMEFKIAVDRHKCEEIVKSLMAIIGDSCKIEYDN